MAYKAKIFGYIFFSLFSIVAQIASLWIAVQYISGLASGGDASFSKFGISIPLGDNVPYLIGTLLLLSSVSSFVASRLLTQTMRLYEERSVYSVLNIFLNYSFYGRPAKAEHLTEADIVKAVTRDARVSGRALSTVWSMIVPTFMVAGSGAFIVYLNAALSFTLFAMAAFFVYFYVLIGKSASQLSEQIQEYSRGDSRNRALFVKYLNSIGSTIDVLSEQSNNILNVQESKNFLDTYQNRLRVVHWGLLIGNTLLALMVFVVLSFFTYRVQHGEHLWAYTLFYFLGLNYCFGNLRTIGKSLTTLSIFFPFFSRYIAFVTQREVGTQVLKDTDEIVLHASQKEIQWKTGEPLVSYSDLEINKVNVNSIIESLMGESASLLVSKEHKVQFATGLWSLWGDSVEDNIEIFKRASRPMSEIWPFERFVELEEQVLARSREDDFSINIWNRKIDRGFKFIVSLLPILSNPGGLILLDGEGYFSLPQEEQDWITQKLNSSFIVLINPPHDLFAEREILQIKEGRLTYSIVHESAESKGSSVSLPDENLLDLDLDLDS